MITQTFQAADGLTLAYHEVGSGRPVVLLHGYMSTGPEIWMRTGIAARLADADRRVIMPDFRGHGASARPHDPAAYPRDALTTDSQRLIAHLELGDYDLGGYSLGGRVVARMLALGAHPRRAVVGGTGLELIVHAAGRGENYRRILSSLGDISRPAWPEAQVEEYLTSTGADPVAFALRPGHARRYATRGIRRDRRANARDRGRGGRRPRLGAGSRRRHPRQPAPPGARRPPERAAVVRAE